MNTAPEPPFDPGAPMSQLAAGWYPDPLDQDLLRYNDGAHWTFWTRTPTPPGQPEPIAATEEPPPQTQDMRPDIAAAAEHAVSLLGSRKELRRLPEKLTEGETVQVVASAAHNGGTGVLAVTNMRVLFYFEGLLRNTFLFAGFDRIHELDYNPATKVFEVYTSRRTKRAVPAFAVVLAPVGEGQRFLAAARSVLAAPRLGSR